MHVFTRSTATCWDAKHIQKKVVIYVSFRPFPDDCRCQVDEEEAAKALA